MNSCEGPMLRRTEGKQINWRSEYESHTRTSFGFCFFFFERDFEMEEHKLGVKAGYEQKKEEEGAWEVEASMADAWEHGAVS